MIDKEVTSFKEYLQLVADHGVIVSAHGTSLMMTLLMVPFSAVVELFPYRVDSSLYPAMATQVAVGNYPVHAPNNTDMEKDVVGDAGGWWVVG